MTVHIFDKKENHSKMIFEDVKVIDVVDNIIWIDDQQFSTTEYDYVILQEVNNGLKVFNNRFHNWTREQLIEYIELCEKVRKLRNRGE